VCVYQCEWCACVNASGVRVSMRVVCVCQCEWCACVNVVYDTAQVRRAAICYVSNSVSNETRLFCLKKLTKVRIVNANILSLPHQFTNNS